MLPAQTETWDAERREHNQVEIDHFELDSTSVSPATARFMSLAFVAMLFVVPVSQAVVELSRSQAPQALDLFTPWVQGVKQAAAGEWRSAAATWRGALKPETLHAYEAAVESSSVLKGYFQPRLQEMLTGTFKVGNEKVVLGARGWLYYQPGLDYVSLASIIDSATVNLAAKKMVDKGVESSPQPDPRPALLRLQRDALAAGIHLVVLPVPDKVMLQPAQLRQSLAAGELPVPNNAGYSEMVRQLREHGVDWFDPAPTVVGSSEIRYLVQDTHWTPAFMDVVAKGLAEHVRQSAALPAVPPRGYRIAEQQVSRVGDLVDMLKLTPRQTIFSPQAITIQRIIDERTGEPAAPDPQADVLLLGDSFSNIYSQPEMGWGADAGFAEHLAYHLQRPIDLIAFNGGGASRVRAELGRPENAERLGAKRVIVYEFAIRNLLGENWKIEPMIAPVRPVQAAPAVPPQTLAPVGAPPSPPAPPVSTVARKAPATKAVATPGAPTDARPGPITVVVRVTQTSKVPAPGTAPYKDCLTFIKVHVESVESGSYAGSDMIVVFPAMKDNQWLPAASYAVGDSLRVTAIPFSQAGADIRSMQRADDTDDLALRPYFALQGERR